MAVFIKRSRKRGSNEWEDHVLVQGDLQFITIPKGGYLSTKPGYNHRNGAPHFKLVLSEQDLEWLGIAIADAHKGERRGRMGGNNPNLSP